MSNLISRILNRKLSVSLLLALAVFVLHMLTNGQYGFHRDELALFDNARHLDWGYVEYPPFTPIVARVEMELLGPSQAGLRLAAAVVAATAVLLAGLIARELGGSRLAQALGALATGIAPIALLGGGMISYSTFDYLWWALIAYLIVRLLKSDDPRWWLAIGATIGLGVMTKYNIVFYLAGIVAGVMLTRARRYLLSPWLWGGVGLALLACLPNLIWQAQHGFVSWGFLSAIHARDIAIGRTDNYLMEQLVFSANLATVPLWVAGLGFYFFAPSTARYRVLGWMFAVPFVLLWALQGRSYYMGGAYPLLFAAGGVVAERWLAAMPVRRARLALGAFSVILAVAGMAFGAIALPVAPVNSDLWDVVDGIHGEFRERIGWPEMAEIVAGIYAGLPAEERAQTGILTWNFGESGAINWYGPAYGLPEAISPANSSWLRGYGDPLPQTFIVLGMSYGRAGQYFETCTLAGRITNRYGVANEESTDNPLIYLCRGPRRPWADIWSTMRRFI